MYYCNHSCVRMAINDCVALRGTDIRVGIQSSLGNCWFTFSHKHFAYNSRNMAKDNLTAVLYGIEDLRLVRVF